MATTSITSNLGNVSSYNSRMVSITFSGGYQPMHQAQQSRSVPYDRLSQTIQNIHRQGGKIINVFMQEVSADQVAKPTNHVPTPEPSQPQANNNKKKKK